ncbi:MAG: excinuclease ABC subunit UvrA [Sumerlaeia bacterium]
MAPSKTTSKKPAAKKAAKGPAPKAKPSRKKASPPKSAPAPTPTDAITIRGARTHNLKNINVSFPNAQLTVVTGLSGSGKSSLAFDTLFAEGQRRYVESLSTYARQFVARLPRPDVDDIDAIPPAIALEQKNSVKNARSTIGTATEINDYLRLIWAKIGVPFCPNGHGPVRSDTVLDVVREAFEGGGRFYVLAPVSLDSAKRLEATLGEMKRQGFTRLFLAGEMLDLDEPDTALPDDLTHFHVVVDRLAAKSEEGRARLAEAVQTAFRIGQGRMSLRTPDGEEHTYHSSLACNECGYAFRPLEPRLFSFGNPLGACPKCQGFGRTTGLDWDRIIPDPTLAVCDGAIAPWRGESGAEMLDDLRVHNARFGISLTTPWKDLSNEHRVLIKYGKGAWAGVTGYFDWLETKRYKVQARIQIARYRGYTECPQCHGERLCEDARHVLVGGKTLAQVCQLPIPQARAFLESLDISASAAETIDRPLREAISRFKYLEEVGLSYLTLARQTRTLSGGEAQRINLATALGSALTETLYVLDEPTVGLHPRDTNRLIGVLRRLTDLGNTVVVVEHDLDVIRSAEYLVDIGPRAGEHGGQVVFQGPPSGLTRSAFPDSKTAPFLLEGKDRPAATVRPAGRRSPSGWVEVRGAYENNLDYLNARFPLGVLCCVTGVSGSGKSTLVSRCLYGNYRREFRGEADADPGKIASLAGFDDLQDVILVDQSPLGRSSRSNAATYLKAYDGIRKLLGESRESKARNLSPRDFSFNVRGGRCESCEGTGRQIIDMQFLADVEVVCDTCDGQRFQKRVLEVAHKGKNINAILDLTVEEALDFFADENAILKGLEPLAEVGLGYLRLGQSTATLSGGEAQRLKLAAHLAEAGKRTGHTLLIFDEPTTGLHAADLEALLAVFEKALKAGYSLLVIEHNLELIRRADWIVDLGPEGGDQGGHLVAEGPPESIVKAKESITGQYLARELTRS